MEWFIGNIKIKNNVVLAPMAGVSNPTYIKILEDFGLGLAVTELISAEAIVRNNAKTFEMLDGIENITIPFGIQLFGANPKSLAAAAKIIVQKYNPSFIDINMGCPVPKVALKNDAGSALLKNPKKVGEIIKAVVEAIDIPVTVKIRSGWDSNSINAVEIARIAEKNGASAIFIHARTRAQGYSGKADWSIIGDVVREVNIPVIGNGDIKSCYDAKKMLDETGCKAVMIGRALMGNPWLVKESVNYLDNGIVPVPVLFSEKIDMMEKHLNSLIGVKNEALAVLEMRGYILSYLAGLPNNKEVKNRICSAKTKNEIINILEDYKKNNNE